MRGVFFDMVRNRLKKFFGLLLAAGLIAANYSAPMRIFRNIPSTLNVQQGQRLEIRTGIPTPWLTVSNEGDLDLGLSHTALTGEAILGSGVEMVLRQTLETLAKLGVETIDPMGQPFDAELHNAVMQGSAEEGEPGTVCMVLQKGYKLGARVIRHAMVAVAS